MNYPALQDLAEAIWFNRTDLAEHFDPWGEPTIEEAIAAPTFAWNKDVGWSFDNLPAGPPGEGGTCPVARASSTCAKCYAQAGNFVRIKVKRAHQRQLLLRSSPYWVTRNVQGFLWLGQTATNPRSRRGVYDVAGVPTLTIREHSSGDYRHPTWIDQDLALCQAIQQVWPDDYPAVRVWVPTRVWPLPRFREALQHLVAAGNDRVAWIIRPSALDLGAAPVVEGLAAGTGVGYDVGEVVCPKILNHSSCRNVGCTTCWEGTKTVSYPLHGQRKNHAASTTVLQREARLLEAAG